MNIDKNWLEKEILDVFRNQDYDGHVSSIFIRENREHPGWLTISMNSHDRFGSEVIYAYVNENTGDVNGDLVDSFNNELESRIKEKYKV
jgi:hypothetical protein